MVWRKYLPLKIHQGKRGGYKRTVKPRWLGPGRVVLHELVPGQTEEDRRGIVSVVLGRNLYRCSVHSVRPLSDQERAEHEATSTEDPSRWKDMKDMIPKREYIDLEHEKPEEDEYEDPAMVMTEGPLWDGVVRMRGPKVRFPYKSALGDDGRPADRAMVNDYTPDYSPSREPEGDSDRSLADQAAKRPRMSESADVDDLMQELELNFNQCFDEIAEAYVLDVPVTFDSNRQRKGFASRNPQLYLVKKLNGAEVDYRKLTPAEKQLFENAKQSEVASFIKTEAVRRCVNWEEQQEAQQTGRVVKSRWVLVWKPIPEESRAEAIKDARENPRTAHTPDGTKKAKARIVVLGFQHPDLMDPGATVSAPVQSQLMRHLSFAVVAQRKWQLEDLDMSTAFLQTGEDEEEGRRVWMQGVSELARALGAEQHEDLRQQH